MVTLEEVQRAFIFGYNCYKLWSTHGMPIEIVKDIMVESGDWAFFRFNEGSLEKALTDGYNWAKEEHRQASKNKKFEGPKIAS